MARLTLLLATLLALAGCATGPVRTVSDHPWGAPDRPNGQPKWLPCPQGDDLC